MSKLEWATFSLVSTMIGFVAIILLLNLLFQYGNYSIGIDVASRESMYNHTAILTYSRAWDFAVVKTSSLFMSFILIFTGAIYVLHKSDAKLDASGEYNGIRGSIQITTPGLILALMGLVIACVAMLVQSRVDFVENSRQDKVSIFDEILIEGPR